MEVDDRKKKVHHHHYDHHRKNNIATASYCSSQSETFDNSSAGSGSRRSWFSTVTTEPSSMSVPSDLSDDDDHEHDYGYSGYPYPDSRKVSPASQTSSTSGDLPAAGGSYGIEDQVPSFSSNHDKPKITIPSSSSLLPSFFLSPSLLSTRDGSPPTGRSYYFSQRLVGLLSILALVQPLLMVVNTDQIFFLTNTSRRAMEVDQNSPPPPPQQQQQQQLGGSGGGASSSFVQNLPALRLGGIIRDNNNSSSNITDGDKSDLGREINGKKPDIIVPWSSILHESSSATSGNDTIVTTTVNGASQRRSVQPPPFDTVTTNPALNASDDYPDEQERVLFLISMGQNARKSRIVERFVYSARTRGKYRDWIVILSDAPKTRYKEISSWTDKLIHIQPDPKHLNPLKHNFTLTSMGYKRLKTYVLEYVATDRRLDHVQLVYYLDVDIVFGDSVWPMFHGLEKTYGIGEGTSPITSTEKFHGQRPDGRMWMFHGNTPKWKLQGGQMFLHRQHSQPCLERWRHLIDSWSRYARKDQDMLMRMLQDQTNAIDNENLSSLQCEVVIMNQKPFIEFPEPKAIVRRARELRKSTEESNATSAAATGVDMQNHHYYSPLVHLRNDGGTKRITPGNIKVYIQDVLQFKEGQKDKLGVLKKMAM